MTEQIYLMNKATKIRSFYSWINAHQDEDNKEEDLPLLAQLNIKADKIAAFKTPTDIISHKQQYYHHTQQQYQFEIYP